MKFESSTFTVEAKLCTTWYNKEIRYCFVVHYNQQLAQIASMATSNKRTEERLKAIETAIEVIMARLTTIDERVNELNPLSKRLEEAESKQAITELGLDEKIKDVSIETDSKVASSELRCEDKLKDVATNLQVIADKTIALEMKVSEMSKEWPTPREAMLLSTQKRSVNATGETNKPSFAEKHKSRPKDTVLLIGDSLARGVGAKLEQQSNFVTAVAKGGAKIEDITVVISKLEKREDRHLVVLVGTNNIEEEGNISIVDKYSKLLDECGKVGNRKISLVGIPRRLDLNSYGNSKRIGVNLWLKELCQEKNAEFISYEPGNRMIARDGLHLNDAGQDELGRAIFCHCKSFLS